MSEGKRYEIYCNVLTGTHTMLIKQKGVSND